MLAVRVSAAGLTKDSLESRMALLVAGLISHRMMLVERKGGLEEGGGEKRGSNQWHTLDLKSNNAALTLLPSAFGSCDCKRFREQCLKGLQLKRLHWTTIKSWATSSMWPVIKTFHHGIIFKKIAKVNILFWLFLSERHSEIILCVFYSNQDQHFKSASFNTFINFCHFCFSYVCISLLRVISFNFFLSKLHVANCNIETIECNIYQLIQVLKTRTWHEKRK